MAVTVFWPTGLAGGVARLRGTMPTGLADKLDP